MMRATKRLFPALAATAAVTAIWSAPSFGQANNDIVGLWNFNGGIVGVTKNADKSFTGTVVKATTTGTCGHPVGERMWTDVRLAGNLNFFGKHVWFLTTPCRPAPSAGSTAWKIFVDVNNKRFLRGCYASWSNTTLQPQIDVAGHADVGPGGTCIDSYAVPAKRSTIKQIVKFPDLKCVGSRLKLTFTDPPTDAIAAVQVYAGTARKTFKRTKMAAATVRPKAAGGTVKIKVIAKTLLGNKITGSKTYTACT